MHVLDLASFSKHSVSFVHVVDCGCDLSSLINIILFYEYITMCSCTLPLMDIRVISGLVLFLVLMLLQAFCACLLVHLQAFLLDISPRWAIGYMGFQCHQSCHEVVVPICAVPSPIWAFHMLHILANTWYGHTFSWQQMGWICSSISLCFYLALNILFYKVPKKVPLLIFLMGCQSFSY